MKPTKVYPNDSKPLLSICCIVYNQINFLDDCLQGFQNQKVNFNVEIIIHDDFSKDGSRERLIEFEKQSKFPVRLILPEENTYSKGERIFLKTFKKASGKYIAMCEGDDYWTDPLKLQKQVDFLETHNDFGIVAHNVLESNSYNTKYNRVIPGVVSHHTYTIHDYILNNKTGTCSLLFKASCFKLTPDFFKVPFGDLFIVLSVLKNTNGKLYVLSEQMGVYRVHSDGVHGKNRVNNTRIINNYKMQLHFINVVAKGFLNASKYKPIMLQKKINTYSVLLNLTKQEGRQLEFFKNKVKYHFFKLLQRLKK